MPVVAVGNVTLRDFHGQKINDWYTAAQESHNQENWNPRLADRFQYFGTDAE